MIQSFKTQLASQSNCIPVIDRITLTHKKGQGLSTKYTDRIPIVITNCDNTIALKDFKYMVPKDLTISQFMQVVRNKCKNLLPSEALFLLITDEHISPQMNNFVIQLWERYNQNGFLLITIQKENVFG